MEIDKTFPKKKQIKLIQKLTIPFTILSIFIFVFGYDVPMFDEHKIVEFSCAYIGVLLIIVIIAVTKYSVGKYTPTYNKCGRPIKKLERDCIPGKIEYLGTVDRTTYENSKTSIKGTTIYTRGGYPMRNSTFERTGESNFEINQKIPIVKRLHVYKVEYRCKTCNELYCTSKTESLEPLNIKRQ